MKSSFRATPAKAGGDPESSPAEGGIQAILDSGACPGHNPGFAGMTE
jgi:hypothetical protein